MRPVCACSPCAADALWLMRQETRGARAQSGGALTSIHKVSTDKEKDDGKWG